MREVRAELGAALRGARARRALAAATGTALELRARSTPRARLALLALAAALAFAVIALVLLPQPVTNAPAGGAPAAAPPATALPTLLRGRSTTAVPVVVVPTAPPTAEPSAAPSQPVGVPGGTGSGGSPGGIVETTRFIGRVIDARTGQGVPGVCIVLGVRQCSENPVYSDQFGVFEIRLPSGSTWDLNFAHTAYAQAYRQVSSTRTQAEVNVGLISLVPR